MSGRPVPTPPPRRHAGLPRLFALYRADDVNGQSGTGVVAYGVRWPNGKVTTWWGGSKVGVSQISQWDGLPDVLKVHGHGGRTIAMWLTAESDDQLVDTAPIRARLEAHRLAALDVEAPLRRYAAAADVVPLVLPLAEAYERLAAAYVHARRDLGEALATSDALQTALDVTASRLPAEST